MEGGINEGARQRSVARHVCRRVLIGSRGIKSWVLKFFLQLLYCKEKKIHGSPQYGFPI